MEDVTVSKEHKLFMFPRSGTSYKNIKIKKISQVMNDINQKLLKYNLV